MRIVSEPEFRQTFADALANSDAYQCGCVTGPGRSGAVAAVYASHRLGIPFIPYGQDVPNGWRLLIVDTATESGKTLRKADRRYEIADPVVVFAYQEPPRVAFWYEADKPQRFKHEREPADRRAFYGTRDGEFA